MHWSLGTTVIESKRDGLCCGCGMGLNGEFVHELMRVIPGAHIPPGYVRRTESSEWMEPSAHERELFDTLVRDTAIPWEVVDESTETGWIFTSPDLFGGHLQWAPKETRGPRRRLPRAPACSLSDLDEIPVKTGIVRTTFGFRRSFQDNGIYYYAPYAKGGWKVKYNGSPADAPRELEEGAYLVVFLSGSGHGRGELWDCRSQIVDGFEHVKIASILHPKPHQWREPSSSRERWRAKRMATVEHILSRSTRPKESKESPFSLWFTAMHSSLRPEPRLRIDVEGWCRLIDATEVDLDRVAHWLWCHAWWSPDGCIVPSPAHPCRGELLELADLLEELAYRWEAGPQLYDAANILALLQPLRAFLSPNPQAAPRALAAIHADWLPVELEFEDDLTGMSGQLKADPRLRAKWTSFWSSVLEFQLLIGQQVSDVAGDNRHSRAISDTVRALALSGDDVFLQWLDETREIRARHRALLDAAFSHAPLQEWQEIDDQTIRELILC